MRNPGQHLAADLGLLRFESIDLFAYRGDFLVLHFSVRFGGFADVRVNISAVFFGLFLFFLFDRLEFFGGGVGCLFDRLVLFGLCYRCLGRGQGFIKFGPRFDKRVGCVFVIGACGSRLFGFFKAVQGTPDFVSQ